MEVPEVQAYATGEPCWADVTSPGVEAGRLLLEPLRLGGRARSPAGGIREARELESVGQFAPWGAAFQVIE